MNYLPIKKQAKELYEALGINDDASIEEIRSSWKRIASKYHPDLNGGKINEIFRRARHAYSILTNSELKAHYDEFGNEQPDIVKSATSAIQQILAMAIDKFTDSNTNLLIILKTNLTREALAVKTESANLEKEFERLNKTLENVEKFWKGADSVKMYTMGLLEQKITLNKTQKEEMGLRSSIIKKALELVQDANYVLPEIQIQQPTTQIIFGGNTFSW